MAIVRQALASNHSGVHQIDQKIRLLVVPFCAVTMPDLHRSYRCRERHPSSHPGNQDAQVLTANLDTFVVLNLNRCVAHRTSSMSSYSSPPVISPRSVSYTHLRAHETDSYLVCRLLLEK